MVPGKIRGAAGRRLDGIGSLLVSSIGRTRLALLAPREEDSERVEEEINADGEVVLRTTEDKNRTNVGGSSFLTLEQEHDPWRRWTERIVAKNFGLLSTT